MKINTPHNISGIENASGCGWMYIFAMMLSLATSGPFIAA